MAEDEVGVLPGRAGGQPFGGLAFSVGLEGGNGALGEFERALGLGVLDLAGAAGWAPDVDDRVVATGQQSEASSI